jgi:putative endonuclease
VKQLVWFEAHDTAEGAILREKRLKRWNRAWKIGLIEKDNPGWADRWDALSA